jgi:hypothetical protein
MTTTLLPDASHRPLTDDRLIVVRFALDRVIGSAYGELSILSQRCMGLVGSGDQRPVILERHSLWKACHTVAAEALRTSAAPEVRSEMSRLSLVIDKLRDLLLAVIDAHSVDRSVKRQLSADIRKVYEDLADIAGKIDASLALGLPFFDEHRNLVRVCGGRSVEWLCDQLEK